jgi:predicted  nucleic acid-binding Zn-ribbon protein
MSTCPFDLFIDLVQFDQEITKTTRTHNDVLKKVADLEKQKQTFFDEIELLKRDVHDAQKVVHEKELEMAKLDNREADLKKRLDDLENIKQYTTLKKELDSVQGEQRSREDALVTAWNQLENVQRTLHQKKDLIEQKITELEKVISAARKEAQGLQDKLDAHAKERPLKASLVNKEWLEKYDMMHGRVENPVVEVVQGGCGGCFYTITDQELARLKRRALLQCNSCYRFLYDPEVFDNKLAGYTRQVAS